MEFNSDIDFNKINIEIISGGYVTLDSSWKYRNCRQFFSRLYFVKEGKGQISTENGVAALTGGKVYLVPANMEFSCSCEHLEKIFFHISLPTGLGRDLLEQVGCVAELDFPEDKFNNLCSLYCSGNYADILSAKTIIYNTVNTFVKSYCKEKIAIDTFSADMRRIVNFIDANLSMELSCEKIAKALYLSESKIRTIIRTEGGLSLRKYISDCVMYKAASLLKSTDNTIARISDELDFCDQFYFSRRFKQYFGKTPSQYRTETKI